MESPIPTLRNLFSNNNDDYQPNLELVLRPNVDPLVEENRRIENGNEETVAWKRCLFWLLPIPDIIWSFTSWILFIKPEDEKRSTYYNYVMRAGLICQTFAAFLLLFLLSINKKSVPIFGVKMWLITTYFLLVDDLIIIVANILECIFSSAEENMWVHFVAQISVKAVFVIGRLVMIKIFKKL